MINNLDLFYPKVIFYLFFKHALSDEQIHPKNVNISKYSFRPR